VSRSRVLRSLLGPGAFAGTALVAARMEPGYRHRDEPVSALAARGVRGAKVMVPGFLGLAAGTLALAADLRGSDVAPDPVPAMLAVAGLSTAAAGLARNSDRSCPSRLLGDEHCTRSDDAHAAFALVTFSLWVATPLVAAARARKASSRYRAWSRRLGLLSLTAMVVGGMLARRDDDRWSGAAQRLTLAGVLGWYPLAAAMAGGAER
jgi:Protein of unknown function (DUF998)